jgi:hypothetical protein
MNQQQAERDVAPSEVDVLCGSGSTKAVHPGNKRFRLVVSQHYADYALAVSKTEKMKVSRRIMKEVVAAGARFLKKNTGSHAWHVADIKVGKDKISHCLREIKNRKSRHAWAQYRPDPPPPPALPQAISSGAPHPQAIHGAQHMTAHCTGQLLYEAQDNTSTQHWNQGTRAEAGTVHSISPFAVSPSNILPDVQPAVASEHEYRPVAATPAGSSADLLRHSESSIPGHGEAWEAEQQVPHSQNQDLIDFVGTSSRNKRQQNYGAPSWKQLHNYDDQKEETGAERFFSTPSWTTEHQQNKIAAFSLGRSQEAVHRPSSRRKPPPWTGHHPSYAVAHHPGPGSAPSAEQAHPPVQPDLYSQWPPMMQQRAIEQQPLPSSDDGGRWSTPPSNEDTNFASVFSDSESASPSTEQQQNDHQNHYCHNHYRREHCDPNLHEPRSHDHHNHFSAV